MCVFLCLFAQFDAEELALCSPTEVICFISLEGEFFIFSFSFFLFFFFFFFGGGGGYFCFC